ncbi:unnamed protein product [Sphagnum balticum]
MASSSAASLGVIFNFSDRCRSPSLSLLAVAACDKCMAISSSSNKSSSITCSSFSLQLGCRKFCTAVASSSSSSSSVSSSFVCRFSVPNCGGTRTRRSGVKLRKLMVCSATLSPLKSARKEHEEEHMEEEEEGMKQQLVRVGEELPEDYVKDDPSKTALQRRCGILLHPSSLPGSYGIGEMGHEAFAFLDWLKATGCRVWQVLPLVPPGRKGGEDGSPYAGSDANCGNTLLISLESLVADRLLEKSDLPKVVPLARVDFIAVAEIKDPLIVKAARNLVKSKGPLRERMESFRKDPRISVWLEEAALFAAIDNSLGLQYWWEWPAALRNRDPAALEKARKTHEEFILIFIAQQFLFQRQWQEVHSYATKLGIKIVGDMPIYVGGHSADVWANQSMFALDPDTRAPSMVSGVPPDAFSATGQLWGSPLYNWKVMAEDRYTWWANRMRRAVELYDEFRIDHFRGLAGYWAIEGTATTAMNGKWEAGPREDFFEAIREAVGKVDIIAEDLGVITGDVVALRKHINAPGMAVLQFAFGSNSRNPHLPHNHEVDQVVYPGTHDNDTVVGWWKKASMTERHHVQRYLRMEEDDDVHWEFIRCSIASVARTTIIPMQDILGLDNDARMNTPATQAGNWGWRVGESGIFSKLKLEKLKLRGLLDEFNRLPRGEKLVEEKAESKPKQLVVEEKADSKPKQLVVEEKQKSNPSKGEIK